MRPLIALLPPSPTLLGLLGLLVVLVCLALIGFFLRGRRRTEREVRELVQWVDDLRSGKARRPGDVDPTSPLGVLSDALGRLGHELHGRWSEAEAASERWRALIDASEEVAVITTDTDGDIRSFSRGACALFGWEEDEVASRPAAVVFEESSYKDLLPKLARRSLRAQGITTRARLRRRDGSEFEAELAVRMLEGSQGQPVGFMMVVRDVTEQRRLEEELRDSEARYRTLVEGLGEGVMIVKGGRVAYANPAMEALAGRNVRELEGTPLRDYVSTMDVLVVEEALREPGGAEEVCCTLVGPDGARRADVRIVLRSVDYAGESARLLLVQDETATRRVHGELARNEMRLDAVLEAASDGIVVLSGDAEGRRVRMTNRSFGELFGVEVAHVLGERETLLVDKLARLGGGAREVASFLAEDGRVAEERSFTLAPREEGAVPREIEVRVAPLVSTGGDHLGRVVACRDVTEQRRSQRQLESQTEKLQLSKVELEQSYRRLNEVNRKLAARGEELDSLNRELRRLDEMKSDLLGNVSHELQTPLVSIRGYTEMILKERLGPISEEQRKGLESSLKNVDRLISMIDGLLSVARGGDDDVRLHPSEFPLTELIDESLEMLHGKIEDRRIEVRVDVARGAGRVQADRDKILQVFTNLLSNAVKFSDPQGRVEVEARPGVAGYARVTVKDRGRGIPADALDRVFERGFRVNDPERPVAEGSGIGLAVVREILERHGCSIRAVSEPGDWTEFVFSLPLAPGDERAPDADPPARAVPRREPESTRRVPRRDPGDGDDPRPRLRIIRRQGGDGSSSR